MVDACTFGTNSLLEQTFYCRSRRRRLTLERCLDDYVDANAIHRRCLLCYRCPQGRANRKSFAQGKPPLGSRAAETADLFNEH